jgi:hypothetical protein
MQALKARAIEQRAALVAEVGEPVVMPSESGRWEAWQPGHAEPLGTFTTSDQAQAVVKALRRIAGKPEGAA